MVTVVIALAIHRRLLWSIEADRMVPAGAYLAHTPEVLFSASARIAPASAWTRSLQ